MRTAKKTRKLRRIQFDLDQELIAQLDYLRQETGCGTRRELMRSMIVLFHWAVEESLKGMFIGSLQRAAEARQWYVSGEWRLDILESVRQRSVIRSGEQSKK